MNTLAAFVSKLGVKNVSRDTQALCDLIDAHVANLSDRLDAMERKVNAMHVRMTRTDSE